MTRNRDDLRIRDTKIIIAFLGILTAIAVGFVLYQIRSIMLPFSLAVFIGYVFNPLITFFEDRKVPGVLAIILTLLITFLVLNFFGVLVYTSIKSFAAEFPRYEGRLSLFLDKTLEILHIPKEVFLQQVKTQGTLKWLSSLQNFSLHEVILNTLGSILNFMSNTFLVLLFLLFILIGRNQLVIKTQLAFPPETALRISTILKNINSQIQKYLIAKSFISLATGILFLIVLLLFHIPFAIIWGILAFLLNFIPNIGSVIATLLPLTIALIQVPSWSKLFWLALILVTIQMVVGNFIDPRIMGRSLNLSPLVVLFSLMFWGWLWGIIGMFLAVPIAVIIKIIFENIEPLRFISVLMSTG